MKKGLRKIVLINSYLSELVSEIDIANNTMITGGNGAGKTSMLKLIPAFFGLKTSKISKKSENADNFVQFYLPYKNSYIIFEYVTNLGNTAQVVLSRHHTNSIEPKVQYRFVSKAFEANDYLIEESEGKHTAFEPQELHSSWSSKHIEFTKAVPTQSDFRKIMQNDELRTVDKDFHPFTLTGGRNNLKHIDYIVHALITGKVSIPDIKSLLAKIMHQSGGDYKLQFNPNEAERWLEYYESVSRFEKKKESYLNTLENGKELMELEDELEQQAQYINAALTALSNEMESLTDSLSEKTATQRRAEAEKNDLVSKKSEEAEIIEGKINGLTKQIDTINNQHEEFINNEIEHKQALFEAIPEKEKDVVLLQEDLEYYKSFSDDIEIITVESNKRVAGKKEEVKRQENEKTQTLNVIGIEHSLTISNIEQTNSKLVSQIEQQFNSEREVAKDELHTAEQEVTNIKNQIAAIPQDEEVVQFDASIAATQVLEVELLTSKNKLSESKSQFDLALLQIEQTNLTNELGVLIDKEASTVKKIEQLDGLKNGSKGSALNALREIDPDLTDNPIIKVLGHELLLRADLSAQIEDIDIDAGIYGLHIDIDMLNAPKEFEGIDAKIEELHAEIEVYQARLNTIRIRMKAIEQELSIRAVELKRIETKITEINNNTQEAVSKRSFLIDKKAALVLEKTTALTKRKDDAEKVLRKANAKISSIEENKRDSLEENSSNHLTTKSDCDTTFSERRDTQEAIFDERIERLKADIKAIRKDADDRINDIDFDNEEFRKKTTEFQALEDTINEYRKYEPLIQSYLQFQQSDLSRMDELHAKRQELLQEKSTITQVISKAQLEWNRTRSEAKAEMGKLNRKIDICTSLQSGVNTLKTSLSDMGIEPKLDSELTKSFSIEDFIASNQKMAAKTQKVAKSVRKELSSIQQELVSNGSEDIRKCWSDEVGQMTSDNNNRMYRAQIIAFERIVNDIIPGFKQLVISNALAMGHNVNEFKLQLGGISKTINDLGRKLSDAVNGCSNYESITDISINLESVIHKIHGWESIVDFCDAYNDWQSGDYKENLLPSELFRNRLKQIIDIKRIGNSDVQIEDLFNVVFGVTENGRRKTARTATDLEKMSSNGLTFLFISTLYLGMIKMQRGASLVSIQWPVDELGKLSTENTLRLIGILESNNIAIATALPEPNIDLMNSFGKMYHIRKDGCLVENHVEKDELELLMEAK
ncbi:ATP-binding protein [Vibrio splendidus]|nr:ATP-binding protein [Vibrio splendidus]MCC4880718.1 ATP-binding protein [Vibrio splendidus]